MKQTTLNFSLLSGTILLAISSPSWSALPWTIVPITPTTLTVPANTTASVQYVVTNQSAKPHTLMMKAIPGITQTTTGLGVCSNPFALSKGASCVLTLQITGGAFTQSIQGGPVLCQQGVNGQPDLQQCYQPASPDQTLNITAAPSLALGDSFGGGTVICLGGAPYLNLIVATADNSTGAGAAWGPDATTTPPAFSNDDGATNTSYIVNSFPPSSYAGQICHDYNGGGYHDWFLPAKNQLNCIYTNKSYSSGFDPGGYYSSTQSGPDGAWSQSFSTGTQIDALQSINTIKVRCVRALT